MSLMSAEDPPSCGEPAPLLRPNTAPDDVYASSKGGGPIKKSYGSLVKEMKEYKDADWSKSIGNCLYQYPVCTHHEDPTKAVGKEDDTQKKQVCLASFFAKVIFLGKTKQGLGKGNLLKAYFGILKILHIFLHGKDILKFSSELC